MSTTSEQPTQDLPLFPAEAPALFSQPALTKAHFGRVLADLAEVADIENYLADSPTPCQGFNLGELQAHVLGWLSFFATALTDPTAADGRPDADAFALGDRRASDVVNDAAARIGRAIDADIHTEVVTMSQARMTGDAVLGMALGEYLVHGWDLATATGRPWPSASAGTGDEAGIEAALAFLQPIVQPEHRAPDSGFFDAEVEAPPDASAFERLLCFAGRDPHWQPA